MLEDIVGADNFRRGVSDYLRQFSFKNAETQDLWNSIAQYTTDMDISKIMDTYTRQMGLPVVTITQEGNRLTLSQTRFLADKNATFDECESTFKYKWEIPLTYVTSNNPSEVHRTWLHLHDNSTSIDLPEGTKWVKFNLRQKGYYRVNYTSEGWKALSDLLINNHEVLSAADRASLLNDAFSLASAGYLNYNTALSLLKYISKETHFVPLQSASGALASLDRHLRDTPVYDKFKKFVQTLLEPLDVDSMWSSSPSETYMDRRRRIVLFGLLSKFEIPSVVTFAHKKFTDWLLNNGSKPDVDVRGIIYETGIKNSSKEEWEKLWKIYLKEDDPQENSRIRNTLAASNDPAMIDQLMELAKDESNVRSQDYILMLSVISSYPVGNKAVWKFVRENWSYLVNRFTLNDRQLGRLIPAISVSYGSEEKLKELKDFFALHPDSGAGEAGRKIALEQIQNNINWLKTHVSELDQALA
uniref:Seminal fluid protein n=1 Tax=Nilaparvata lugens TaxID=108931 RepID=A0A1I9WLJ1_NILLU|nr:seminal fluid protein [Nilaparvata lugens]